MHSDPIADLLTRIRNASRAGKEVVMAPHSYLKESLCQILEDKKFIKKARLDQTGKFPELRITLSRPIELKRVSKPGLRVYKKAIEITPVKNGFGIAIISTSKGLMTGDQAKDQNLGGELLCEIS